MNLKRFTRAAKKAAEYFTAGVGAVSLLFVVIGAFVTVSPYISLPIAGGVGLLLACSRVARLGDQDFDEHFEKAALHRDQTTHDLSEMKLNLNEIKRKLNHEKSTSEGDSKAIFSAMNTHPIATLPTAKTKLSIDTKPEKVANVIFHPISHSPVNSLAFPLNDPKTLKMS